MAVFRMLDINDMEYYKDSAGTGIYKENKWFFSKLGNWFYFANDKRTHAPPDKVSYGSTGGGSGETDPKREGGAAVLFCVPADEGEISKMTRSIGEGGLIRFKLNNGADAYFSLLRINTREVISFTIPNNDSPRKFDFPYSNEGNCRFDKASEEEGTLPYMVANDSFMELIPEEYHKFLGSKAKDYAAEERAVGKENSVQSYTKPKSKAKAAAR